jgi:outer membrane receptor for ferrienterochelin and colicins
MTIGRIAALSLAAQLVAFPLAAQRPDSGRVEIIIEESMGMLAGFRASSGGTSALTDAAGRARLTLPVGSQVINVTRVGFKPSSVTVVVLQNSLVSVKVTATMNDMAMQMNAVKVSATRIEKLAGETPTRVEIVDEMEVDEKTLMAPSGISMLLNETPGIRVQQAAPGLGTGSVRILGMPGQYTVMLADGLPLYGGSMSAMGPLDISPVDLQRVEVIKGAASALYGGQSLGGVIDLISKPPTGKKEFLLNRRMLGVTDAATWMSHRFDGDKGLSLLAAGTLQTAEDIDKDGWADQAKATRWSIRPRFNVVSEDGSSLFMTAGYGHDDRAGGTLGNSRAPDGQPFPEGLRSNRADAGATWSTPRGSGNVAMRAALAANSRERTFGLGFQENDRVVTGFVELTRSFSSAKASSLFGGALQVDGYENTLNESFDRNWFTPGLFFTTERNVGSLTVSASVRADAHPDAGVRLTERFAVLMKPTEDWSVRASVGTGYAAPTPMTEETEAIGLRAISLGGRRLKTETSLGAMLDVNGKLAGAELLVTAYGSRISNAIRLGRIPGLVDDAPPGNTQAALLNSSADARIGGVEGVAVWRFEGGKFIGSYGYSRGSEIDPETSQRVEMPMLPRHRLGGDLMMEKEGVNRWGIEGIWYGEQTLHDNPFRMKSKPYVYLMAIYAHQFGPVEIVANFENLLNIRQTDYDPLVRPTQTHGGRWTTDVWAPLEGFMANVALRFRWE